MQRVYNGLKTIRDEGSMGGEPASLAQLNTEAFEKERCSFGHLNFIRVFNI